MKAKQKDRVEVNMTIVSNMNTYMELEKEEKELCQEIEEQRWILDWYGKLIGKKTLRKVVRGFEQWVSCFKKWRLSKERNLEIVQGVWVEFNIWKQKLPVDSREGTLFDLTKDHYEEWLDWKRVFGEIEIKLEEMRGQLRQLKGQFGELKAALEEL